jgi:LAO/AO transport system kinase
MNMQPAAETNNIVTLVDRLRLREVRAIARAISLIEDDATEARELLSACFPHTGNALRIGITGSPGAGKSSLVDQLCRHYLDQSTSVGVLAVDPSSPYTGGALLGDRIRMQEHHADPSFYLRSMATRGALGGLARSTSDAASVLDAAGFDRIFIETVGVGQDEIDIVSLADITIVVLVPGMGDDVQSIKAGIMEVADIFVINKNDREGADRVEAEVRAMQSQASSHSDWIPLIVRTVGTSGDGISTLAAAIEAFQEWLGREDRLTLRRKSQWKQRLAEMVRHQLLSEARLHGLGDEQLEQHASAIVSREEDPFHIVPAIVAKLMKHEL